MAKVTFLRLAISNLGPFKEQQVLLTNVRAGKPVVLVKALNGSGKTTLLTCLQIALYGSRMLGAGRASDYEQLIAGMRRADAEGAPTIELDLRIEVNGEVDVFTLMRTWRFNSGRPTELVSVLREGSVDYQLTEEWDEYFDTILPAELAQLFLFDGEKIEALANPRTLPDMLRRATEAFLGIGGIESLAKDLMAVERRAVLRAKEQSTEYSHAREELLALEEQDTELQERLTDLRLRTAEARTAADVEKANLERFTAVAQRSGLAAYEKAGEIRAAAEHAQNRLTASLFAVRESLADPYLPFAGLKDMWERYADQWGREKKASTAKHVLGELVQRDKRVLAALEGKLGRDGVTVLKAALSADAKQYQQAANVPQLLLSSADPTAVALRVEKAASVYRAAVAELHEARRLVAKAERRVNSIPEGGQLKELVEQLQERSSAAAAAAAKAEALAAQVADTVAAKQHVEMKLGAARSRLSKDFRGQVHEEKAIAAGQRARTLLSVFKEELLASKAAWLSEMITTEFRALMRKQRLVSRVVVQPDTYAVTIESSKHHELPMERLSAGERQLLAIAVLSALIKERKGRFPVVVDTPLARLDRQHREALVQRFFSRVSHQVMVLSTDEEVDDALYAQMERFTSAAYTLEYSDGSRSTRARTFEEALQ